MMCCYDPISLYNSSQLKLANVKLKARYETQHQHYVALELADISICLSMQYLY